MVIFLFLLVNIFKFNQCDLIVTNATPFLKFCILFYLQTSESLKTHDQSRQKLLRLNSSSKTRKPKSSHAEAALRQAQAQTSKHPSSQASLTKTQPKSSSSVLPNQSLASKFEKSSPSKSTSKHSLSFQDAAKRSPSTKKQFLAKKIGQKQPQSKSTSKTQNLIHKSAHKRLSANKSKSKQPSPTKTAIKKKKTTKPKQEQSKITKKTSFSGHTGKKSSVAKTTRKSSVKTKKPKAPAATLALKQTSSSQRAVRSHLVPKSKPPTSKVSKSETKRASSKRSPPNNLPGSKSTSKRIAKFTAKSQGCSSARHQRLASKNKPRKKRPFQSVNQSPADPAFLRAPKHPVHKSHPPVSCLIKPPPSQLQTPISKPHKPCQNQPKKQPSENSVAATPASHIAPTTVFADITTTAAGGPNGITTSIAQITPNAKALTTILSPSTTISASQLNTQLADTTTTGRETTILEEDTATAGTGTMATATTSATDSTTTNSGTTVEETAVTAPVTSPTATAGSTNSGTGTATAATAEVLKTTTAAPGVNTSTRGAALLVTDITSAPPDATPAANTTADTVPEDVTSTEEYPYGTEDYDSASEYEYEDPTAVPESNATGPVTPSTPAATSPK